MSDSQRALKSLRSKLRIWLRSVAPLTFMFVLINLAVTIVSFVLSDSTVRIGVLRPQGLILPKLAELAFVGVALGILSSVTRKGLDPVLIGLSTAFVLLLDLDHLPSTLGFAQPIRPAHTLAFLLLAIGAFSILNRSTPETELMLLSSFLGHIAADTGLFGPFEPVSFTYVSLQDFRVTFAILAVLSALLAGGVRHGRLRTLGSVLLDDHPMTGRLHGPKKVYS